MLKFSAATAQAYSLDEILAVRTNLESVKNAIYKSIFTDAKNGSYGTKLSYTLIYPLGENGYNELVENVKAELTDLGYYTEIRYTTKVGNNNELTEVTNKPSVVVVLDIEVYWEE